MGTGNGTAAASISAHAFADPYVDVDGLVKIRADMAPPPLLDTDGALASWQATASTTVTEKNSKGQATSDLEAGDIVYIGTNIRTVVSITDDDNFVVDSALTVDDVVTRKTSGVYLRLEDWVKPPDGHDKEALAVPDQVIVRYTVAEDFLSSTQYPTIMPTCCRKVIRGWKLRSPDVVMRAWRGGIQRYLRV